MNQKRSRGKQRLKPHEVKKALQGLDAMYKPDATEWQKRINFVGGHITKSANQA